MVRLQIRMKRCFEYILCCLNSLTQGYLECPGRQRFPACAAKWRHHWPSLLASILQVFKRTKTMSVPVETYDWCLDWQAIVEPRKSPGGKYQWWTSTWNGGIFAPTNPLIDEKSRWGVGGCWCLRIELLGGLVPVGPMRWVPHQMSPLFYLLPAVLWTLEFSRLSC